MFALFLFLRTVWRHGGAVVNTVTAQEAFELERAGCLGNLLKLFFFQ